MSHAAGQPDGLPHLRPRPQDGSLDASRRPLPAQQVAAVARSSLKRYPTHVVESWREHHALRRGEVDTPAPLSAESLHALEAHRLGAAWLGHASVLLRVHGKQGGKWILTDPVFSRRIGVQLAGVTFGPRRHTPAPDPAHLPRPDIVLLSHAHFDHLDRPTLAALAHPDIHVITACRTRRLIPRGFGPVHELGWNESLELQGLRFGTLRPRHWGARTLVDRLRGYNAYTIDTTDHRVLFAGDSAYTNVFAEVRDPALSLFGIGAYDPWIDNHASPEEAWTMFRSTGGTHLLPIHHFTFTLSHEPRDEPLQRLLAAAGEERWRIVAHTPGDVWHA